MCRARNWHVRVEKCLQYFIREGIRPFGHIDGHGRKILLTDLINALPANSSVNTVQHATIEEAVFSVSAVTSRSVGRWSRDMCSL
jgi:hypothetical protein